MLAVELVKEDGKHLETKETNRILTQLRENGVIVGKIGHAVDEPENIIYIAPPLILTTSEADKIYNTLREVLIQQ